jgi:hypothetical protein
MNKGVLVLAVIVFLAATGISYYLFSSGGALPGMSVGNPAANPTPVAGNNDYQALTFDSSQPKTEACPINGVMYGADQKAWWSKHRPLGVMIENSTDARPQSGIPFADVTYEAVAEGGITRTLNIYYCQDAGIIGPVRSARTYFVDFVSEYADYPLYAHVGGANTPGPADALGQITDYGWTGYNDLNQFSIGFPTYWRDENRQGHPVATEHTMYSTTTKLWTIGQQRGLTNVDKKGAKWNADFTPYTFKDDAPASARPASQKIHVDFWHGDEYAVDWTYNKETNDYARNNGGQPHMDRNTHKQLTAKDIIVLYMDEEHADDGYTDNEHLVYGDKGTGKATFFMDGKKTTGTWKKASRTDRTMLYDANDNELKLNRGHIWFEIEPLDGEVTVQ